jgi:hypothetical protein
MMMNDDEKNKKGVSVGTQGTSNIDLKGSLAGAIIDAINSKNSTQLAVRLKDFIEVCEMDKEDCNEDS